MPPQPLLHECHEQGSQRERFATQCCHAAEGFGRKQGVESAIECDKAQDRRRAALKAGDAGSRDVIDRKRKGRRMAPPAGQRLPDAIGMARIHPQKGRGAGAAIEVFVAATDRKVGPRRMQVDRYRPGTVGQVPDGQDAGLSCLGTHRGHIVHRAGPVVDMGEHQHRDVVAQCRRQLIALDQAQCQSAIVAQRLRDVEVGREIAALAHDRGSARISGGDVQGCTQRLVEIDRGAVGGHHLAGLRADQMCDLVADPLRQIKPAGGVPAGDQALAPFVAQCLGDSRRRRQWQGPE